VAKRQKDKHPNPNAADGQGFTSRKTADRYIRRGVAIIGKDASGEYLEFKSTGPAAHVNARRGDANYSLRLAGSPNYCDPPFSDQSKPARMTRLSAGRERQGCGDRMLP
jgi:hypothetical protein